jgi:hypothetical protein
MRSDALMTSWLTVNSRGWPDAPAVKARCNNVRYSDYFVVAIGLAGTDLVHTNLNDLFVVTIIVVIVLFPSLYHRYNERFDSQLGS